MFTRAELLRRIKRNEDGTELPDGKPLMKTAQHGRLAIDEEPANSVAVLRVSSSDGAGNEIEITFLPDMIVIERGDKVLCAITDDYEGPPLGDGVEHYQERKDWEAHVDNAVAKRFGYAET